MKDESFWVVVEEGKTLASGIRCDQGKEQAKEFRRVKERQTGKAWKAIKTTKKELSSTA